MVVERTVYDTMLAGLEEIKDSAGMKVKGKDATLIGIVCMLLGHEPGTWVSKTLPRKYGRYRKLVKFLRSVDVEVVEVIRDIVNFEDKIGALSRSIPGTSEAVVDLRIYRNIFSMNNLMNITTWSIFQTKNKDRMWEHRTEIQIATLSCIFFLVKSSRVRSASGKLIDEQFICYKIAVSEVHKLTSFLNKKPWPPCMSNVQEDLLFTTRYDDETECNEGNCDKLLPKLSNVYTSMVMGGEAELER